MISKWWHKLYQEQPGMHPGKAVLEEAEMLLRDWPDEENIPPTTHMFAFGVAAYLYCRKLEMERREYERKKEQLIQEAKDQRR